MAKEQLSDKQQQILEFIKRRILDKGYPPAVREICEAVNLRSTSSVHSHLETLERKVIGIIIAVVFVFLMSTFLLSNNLIEAQETKDKQFTSIQVQKGDTLWKIAKKYMGNEYSSVDDYIEEVCQTNHIYDGKITEDMYLVIPYYK